MKVQELLENEERVMRFNTIEEYQQFIDDTASDSDKYHFEEIEADGGQGELYDIIVEVGSFQHTPGRTNDPHQAETPEDLTGDTEVEWNVMGYGSGNFDEDKDFWFKWGQFPLSQQTEEMMDDRIVDDQLYHNG